MIKHIKEINGAPKPVGAYSAAVLANGFLFCAGQIGLHPETGALVPGGVAAEAKQVLENLKAVLHGGGSGPHHIVMTTIFLADIADSKTVNELYSEFVAPAALPARQTVAVKDLPMGAKVEISLIAVSGVAG